MYQDYGNILYMYVLPERTDYLSYFSRYTHFTSVHLTMHINILCKICFSIFDGICFYLRCWSVDLKPNVTLAPHNYWFYLILIHARLFQKNFPNVYKKLLNVLAQYI